PTTATCRRDTLIALLRDREDPDDSTLWHVLRPPEQIAQETLLERRVDTPAGGDADVLHAVHPERHRGGRDAGVGPELPEHLARVGVERREEPVIRPAIEHEAAAGGEDRTPVHRIGIQMAPDALVAVDVPRLDLAEVLRGLVDGEADVRDVDASPPLAGHVLLDLALHEATVVVVRRNVEHLVLR